MLLYILHEFLRNPKKEDFEKKQLNINDLKARAEKNKLLVLEAAGTSIYVLRMVI